ncbi:MAG: hypothetical protein ACLR06_16995 [Christensenellaceae bacterium]
MYRFELFPMYERSQQLLDEAFAAYENVRILGADTPVRVKVKGKTAAGYTKEDLYYPLLPEEQLHLKMEIISREEMGAMGKTMKLSDKSKYIL